jgi:hypothetical protein
MIRCPGAAAVVLSVAQAVIVATAMLTKAALRVAWHFIRITPQYMEFQT